MDRKMPDGFKQIWGALPQDPSIFAEHNSYQEFARFIVESVSGYQAAETADYIARLRLRSDLDLDAFNELLKDAGSQFMLFDRDELMTLLTAIEDALRKK